MYIAVIKKGQPANGCTEMGDMLKMMRDGGGVLGNDVCSTILNGYGQDKIAFFIAREKDVAVFTEIWGRASAV